MRRVELGVREKQRNLVGAALPPNGERPALTATAVVGLDDLHSWKVSILAQTGLGAPIDGDHRFRLMTSRRTD
jgi:hypothetical protein